MAGWGADSLAPQLEADHGLPAGGVRSVAERLAAAGPAADLALRHALARWWAAEDRAATSDGFRAAGLRIVD